MIKYSTYLIRSLLLFFVVKLLFCATPLLAQDNSRDYWLSCMERVAYPVLINMSNDSLKSKIGYSQNDEYLCLEAFGRTLCGLSRWLELEDGTPEDSIRTYYRSLVVRGIITGLRNGASNRFNFSIGIQPLVDAAYMVQGLLRCPSVWSELPTETQQQFLLELESLRRIEPHGNNWLLFASMIETFLLDKTGRCDKDRLFNGIYSFVYGFYAGDGLYGDGNDFIFNYYNSFVIHPMLMDILLSIQKYNFNNIDECLNLERKRYARYVQLLERQIMEDGSLPIYGRTVTCRLGMLNAMAEFVCLSDSVPHLSFGQIRSAMTAALIKNLTDNDFDSNGFLKIGFHGEQLALAEDYISAGSSYHCTSFFLPLGLPSAHPFWASSYEPWTAVKIYQGNVDGCDGAYIESKSVKSVIRRLYWRYKNLGEWVKIRITVVISAFVFFSLIGMLFVTRYLIKQMVYFYRR